MIEKEGESSGVHPKEGKRHGLLKYHSCKKKGGVFIERGGWGKGQRSHSSAVRKSVKTEGS